MKKSMKFGSMTMVATAILVLASTGFAWAHHVELTGVQACPGPDHVITWTIGNSQKKQTMTIDSAVATLNGTNYTVDGFVNPIPDSGTTSATTTIPGAETGTVTLSIKASWSDGHKRPGTYSLDLDDPCPTTPTTTPTTTSPPTTMPTATTTPTDTPTTGVVPPTGTYTGGCYTQETPTTQAGTPCPPQAFTGNNTNALRTGGLFVLLIGLIALIFAFKDRTPAQRRGL